MQHDPENEVRRGGLRPDASAYAERRNTHPGKIPEFLKSSECIEFTGQNRGELYARVLVGPECAGQGKEARGLIRAYVSKLTGLSLAQVTRLIRQYRQRE